MHICFITHEYPQIGTNQGGIGSFVQTIGRKLVKRDITVSVIGVGNFDTYEEENDLGVRIYRIPKSKRSFFRFWENSRRLLHKLSEIHTDQPIDIVEGAELSFAFFPKKFFAKKVIRMHGGHHFFAVTLGKEPAPWRSLQEKRSFARADAVCAVSDYVSKTTKQLLNLDCKVTIIYNIVNIERFFKADITKIVPKKLLFIGTVTEKKGVRQLVEAMPKILKAFPDATLDIVGRDWHHPSTGESFTQNIKTTIGRMIETHVNFIGPLPQDQLPMKMQEAEICVYPSHMEAQGLVVVEAMSMGKATIFSITGPGPEMITPDETGLLCDPYSPDDIAKKIIYMFEHPREAKQMGLNARKDILCRFDMNYIVQQNVDFYRSLL